MRVSISLDENEVKLLRRRAKRNLLTLKEQIEDIIRRSCIRGNKPKSRFKCDDKLVGIFSRERRGRKRKKKRK